MEDDAAVLDELLGLATAEKTAGTAAAWTPNTGPGRSWLRIACPLAIDGVLVGGLRLELHGPREVRSNGLIDGLTANLIATRRGRDWHLGRIDFGSSAAHRNSSKDRDLLPLILGSHFHGAERNAKLGLSALSPIANLPIAIPLETTPSTFSDVLNELRNRFNIVGLWLEEPPWSVTLL